MAAYEYIFIWDEDLGVDHFNAEEYAFIVPASFQCYSTLTLLHIINDDVFTGTSNLLRSIIWLSLNLD